MFGKKYFVISIGSDLLRTKDNRVLVFDSEFDARHCVDEGRTYEDLDYTQIEKKKISFSEKIERYERDRKYFF